MALHLPLELFVMVGTFIEEVLSPLPSFMVLLPAGAAAHLQGLPVWYLGVLALFSGIGRIAGALVLYVVADKSEDLVLRRRTLFGVSHKEVERFGKRLGKSGWRDWTLLFLMNAIPIFPTAVLSLACGFVKVPLQMFVGATFIGTLINAMIYLGLGYGGFMVADSVRGLELTTQITSGIIAVAIGIWLLRRSVRARRTRVQGSKQATKKGLPR